MQAIQVVTLAQYNSAMNRKLYATVSLLSDPDRRQDRGAFFGSIYATLNHLLLVDRLWFGRIVGRPSNFHSLDQELYTDFEEMRRARLEMDTQIESWAQALTDQQLTADLIYRDMSNVESSSALWVVVTHLFNHQTHHRGQITTLLSQAGLDIGVTDFPWVVEGLVTRPVT